MTNGPAAGGCVVVLSLLMSVAGGCQLEERDWVLPDPAAVTAWYGEGVDASLDGNVLEVRGTVDPIHLRRGGRIWARSGPYFYLFNVHVQRLFDEYPDLAGVRAVTLTGDGSEVARALLTRSDFPAGRWREGLARTALAQQQGTRNPRLVERLTRFGEEHTAFKYGPLAE